MSTNCDLSLNLYTWNAAGVMTSGIYLSDLLHKCDINFLGICEHWLFEKDLYVFNTFSNLYSSYAVSDKDLVFNGTCRMGKGGVAILWKKKYDSCVSQLPFICDRILGIQVEFSPQNFLYLFQIYLPSKNNPIDNFKEYLDSLQTVISEYRMRGSVVLMGDFNCHVNSRHFRKTLDSRDKLFNTFLYDNNLTTVTSLDLCGGAPVSFESNRGRSIIDHIILSTDDINSISYCAVVEDSSLLYSNHRAVQC